MKTAEIGQRFVGYYEKLGYQTLPSAPMIDPSIPMSFVMSAGLVQVENSIAKSTTRDGNQYVLVQNCFRHFDLEKVGTDDIHLSLFEMPGAFVFGSNRKNATIRRMWDLVISVLGIEKEHIWASYFAGGAVLDNYLPEDIETKQAWLNVGLSPSRVVGLGPENNFWMQGRGIDGIQVRKCGPNTELFYDRGGEKACSQDCHPGCTCGRFIEFSNSLFICFEIDSNNNALSPLAQPFTETVIGIERVAMILQKVRSVFEISLYKPILDVLDRSIAPIVIKENSILSSKRVIADHLRGLYYLIESGAPPPGKNGRGRIIKMLIRRVLTRLILLDINVQQNIPVLIATTAKVLPDKTDRKDQISDSLLVYFLTEYERFMKTVKQGKYKLDQIVKENNGKTLSGIQIAYLEKRWGLPHQLTKQTLWERGLLFAEAEYKSVVYNFNNLQENHILGGRQHA
jgi:alanyl-tRNA synthetase